MSQPGPVEYASMDRRRVGPDIDYECAPCAMGYPGQCQQDCASRKRDASNVRSAVCGCGCAAPVRVPLTVDQARADLRRRYAMAWQFDGER